MEIVTSWMEKGIERGREEGREKGEKRLVILLLKRRLGIIPRELEAEINGLSLEEVEALGEALLEDFQSLEDLVDWLGERIEIEG